MDLNDTSFINLKKFFYFFTYIWIIYVSEIEKKTNLNLDFNGDNEASDLNDSGEANNYQLSSNYQSVSPFLKIITFF